VILLLLSLHATLRYYLKPWMVVICTCPVFYLVAFVFAAVCLAKKDAYNLTLDMPKRDSNTVLLSRVPNQVKSWKRRNDIVSYKCIISLRRWTCDCISLNALFTAWLFSSRVWVTVRIRRSSSVVFAGNAFDIMLTCDHAYNSTLHLDLLLLAIFTQPTDDLIWFMIWFDFLL